MAVRENQGLQISLIIFAVLMIGTSVCAFMFFRWYEEALLSAKVSVEKKKEANDSERDARVETSELKKLLGADANDTLASIQEGFKEDMKNYAASIKEPDQHYRELVKVLQTELISADTRFVDAKQREEELKAKIAAEEQVKVAEIAQYKTNLDKSIADLKTERDSFNESREQIESGKSEIAKQIGAKQKELEEANKKSSDEILALNTQVEKLGKRINAQDEILKNKETFADMPRGKITFINQRDRIVWVNVGSADGLHRQVTFKVLGPDEPNLVDAKSKASIEVVRVLDKHLAEARIVSDKISDPILPGDQNLSLVWTPGQTKRFALVGFMDIDGDHESDRGKIKNMIAVNGGIVDAEVTDEGKRVGNMSINTSYVVVGEQPSDKGVSAEFLKAYSEMLGEANTLGIRRINREQFLDDMGYVPEEHAVVMDEHAEPSDFKPKADQGVRRKSNAQFSPRKPHPVSARKSAY